MGLSETLGAGVLLGCLLLTGACETRQTAESSGDGGQPSTVQPEPFTPLEPAPGRFVASDGRISVPVPGSTDEGWECLEERNTAGTAEGSAAALRCRRTNPREFLFMAAKTHRQPPDQRTNAKTVLMTLYREDALGLFESVESLGDGPATLAGAEGWEAEFIGEHGRLGPIHKRERLAIVGDRIFAISAEGVPELWQRHSEAIDRWFAEVEFAVGANP